KDDYKSEYSSYGKYDDRDHDKYKKDSSSIFVKKVNCNNINVNLNGINVKVGLPDKGQVTEPIAVAQALDNDNEGTESFVNNGQSGQSDANTNSRIVCINNNNNIVIGEREPTCEDCFTTVLTDEELDDLIQAIEELSEGEVS
ncbi:MAG TPA: hypothetical protein VFM31_02415, partial [Nitrososphaeraceae archaeon]|nr:hypothetical protein [Nitrososphaeraceae archaeon]